MMISIEPPIQGKRKLFCNYCMRETNHLYKNHHIAESWVDLGINMQLWEQFTYILWICAGCEHATLERLYTNDGYMIDDGKYDYDLEYYPQRQHDNLKEKKFKKLPPKLKTIYFEAIQAFNLSLFVLCGAGLRTLIEGICEDQNIHGHNLEKKINGLNTILPQNITTNLHSLRFMGNAAMHEITAPKRADLLLAIEICEDLLNIIYELNYKASQLAIANSKKRSSK